jgi:hypothetical protein
MEESTGTVTAEAVRCSECGTTLPEGYDREVTAEGTFCRSCFERLREEVRRALEAQGVDVPWTRAALGGLAGAVLGILAWWGFTVLTSIAFGLIAVGIGIAVGKGVTLAAGGKRSRGLQVLSILISVSAFAYASYLVNRTFVHRAWAEQGTAGALPLFPHPPLFIEVATLGFGVMDVVFLAIVVYQAWKIPAPIRLAA